MPLFGTLPASWRSALAASNCPAFKFKSLHRLDFQSYVPSLSAFAAAIERPHTYSPAAQMPAAAQTSIYGVSAITAPELGFLDPMAKARSLVAKPLA